MQSNWIPSNMKLPQDGELKLASVREGNYYYYEILRYNIFNNYWMFKDEARINDDISVRAWADLLPLYTG